MTLDRRHLVGALALLASSVVYNVWALAEAGAGGEPVAVTAVAPTAAQRVPASGDRLPARAPSLEPAADVELGRPPEWTRDPFSGAAVPPPPQTDGPVESPAPAPTAPVAVDPQLILTSVLYSPARKLAMVNGRTVGVGDAVDGATIVDILPSAVVARFPSGSVRRIERVAAGSQRRRP